MAFEVTCKDELSQLLDDSRLNKRHDIWLWLYLHHNQKIPMDRNTCNSTEMRKVIACTLRGNSELIDHVKHEKHQYIVPIKYLEWISSDDRQYYWLYSKIYDLTGKNFPPELEHLIGQSELVAMFDLWTTDMREKVFAIKQLHTDWMRHVNRDHEFEWFTDKKDGIKRCICAWEWIQKNTLLMGLRYTPISNYKELLMYFDQANLSPIEQRGIIKEIKARWNRKQYNERNPDKKQVNVSLSKTVITQLDKLAKQHNMQRSQVVETLLKMETDAGVYLAKKEPVKVVTPSSSFNKANPSTGFL